MGRLSGGFRGRRSWRRGLCFRRWRPRLLGKLLHTHRPPTPRAPSIGIVTKAIRWDAFPPIPFPTLHYTDKAVMHHTYKSHYAPTTFRYRMCLINCFRLITELDEISSSFPRSFVFVFQRDYLSFQFILVACSVGTTFALHRSSMKVTRVLEACGFGSNFFADEWKLRQYGCPASGYQSMTLSGALAAHKRTRIELTLSLATTCSLFPLF